MRILICGAGMGGLTTALLLHERGFDVRVIERVKNVQPVGAGINILPHGSKVLADLGLTQALDSVAIRTAGISYLTKYGQEVYTDRYETLGADAPVHYSIHRGALQQILLKACKARLGEEKIITGQQLQSFTQNEREVEVHCLDREAQTSHVYKADMLIGADGINSSVRRQLFPEEGGLCFSGVNLWRGVLEADQFLDGRTMMVAGNGQTHKVVVYPISNQASGHGRQLINWVATIKSNQQQPSITADWNRPANLNEFYPAFEAWEFPQLNVAGMLRATPKILHYPMVDREPLPRWSFSRVSLLGDAAHPMYPVGANGASQAFLDAAALADAIKQAPDDPVQALADYESVRREKTAAVVQSNRNNANQKILDVVERRQQSASDDVQQLISQEEIQSIQNEYRRITTTAVELA